MAKNPETATAEAAAPAPEETSAPSNSLTIAGLTFSAAPRYSAGHVLSANEASALNQTRLENLRNNFANTVSAHREEVAKARGIEVKDVKAEDLDKAGLEAKFAEYEAGYEFGTRKGGGRIGDPVEREMRAIAKSLVIEALKSKGIKIASVEAAQMDGFIAGVLAKREETIRKEATRRVNSVKNVALEELGL